MGEVTADFELMQPDWLRMLRTAMAAIMEVLSASLPAGFPSREKLSDVEVHFAHLFGEEWSAPYEVCWQADCASCSIVMPNIPELTDRHFDHYKARLGHQNRGHSLVELMMDVWLVPCHEVIHIAQHLHGSLIDSDTQSFAMEHDASRLNY